MRRRKRREVSLQALPGWDTSLPAATRQVCDDPEATVQRREDRSLFQEVVEELTEQQWMVLSLGIFHGVA